MREHVHPQTGQPIGAPVDDTPARRPGPVTLKGRYGRVEKLNARHAPSLWGAFEGHDVIWTYMSQSGPFTDAVEFSAWVESRAELKDPYVYAIVDRENRAVGIIALLDIHPAMRAVEVGLIVFSPALQRTTLGTEAHYLLARYAFETLGYRRYQWTCNSHNAASRRAMLRYGFTFEGILRAQMIAKKRNCDTAIFSILDHEWPLRKANFEQWLAADNFSSDGRQIVSLGALNSAVAAAP